MIPVTNGALVAVCDLGTRVGTVKKQILFLSVPPTGGLVFYAAFVSERFLSNMCCYNFLVFPVLLSLVTEMPETLQSP